jgi:hypothetical protein
MSFQIIWPIIHIVYNISIGVPNNFQNLYFSVEFINYLLNYCCICMYLQRTIKSKVLFFNYRESILTGYCKLYYSYTEKSSIKFFSLSSKILLLDFYSTSYIIF